MDINLKVKSSLQIEAFYLFFIIHSFQIGVGLLGMPRLVIIETGPDGWISILIAFIFICIVVTVMFLILKQYDNTDIFGIHVDLFGRWIGKLFGSIYIIYFSITLLSILITYTEVVRVFIFPSIETWVLGLLLLSLVVYAVLGGIRVIVGVCTLTTFFFIWMLLLLIQPAIEIDPIHLLPIFNTSLPDLLKGAKGTIYSFTGFEILLVLYPFIQNKKNIRLPVYLGVAFTTLIGLAITIVAIGYFSLLEIERREWIVLNLFKLQSFAFIERFDFIVVSAWMIVILPNMMILMWGITYGIKRLYRVPQRRTIYVVAIALLIATSFFNEHFMIQSFINTTSDFSFWLAYIYPFILLPIVFLKKKLGKKGG